MGGIKMKLLLVVAMLFLTGCAEATDENNFKHALESLETALLTEDWSLIEEQVEAIENQYIQSKWKLQLLGDEDEYESLLESVNQLKRATKLKDKADCEKELTSIETYLQQIYSL